MPGHPAVGVDDDLPAGEPGVAHRAADDESAGRVDQQTVIGNVDIQQQQLRRDHLLGHVHRQQLLQVDVFRVLGRDHHRVQPDRPVTDVLDRYLRLAVGTQVRHGTGLAHGGEPTRQPVRQSDRQRHQFRGVGAGIAEHQALVASTLPVDLVLRAVHSGLARRVDALGDVGRLRTDRHVHAAGRAVEPLGGRVVADGQHGVADDLRDVRVGRRGHLTGHVDLAGGDHRLDGDPAGAVLAEQLVQDRVADRVTDLVRVSFGDRFGREQAGSHDGKLLLGIRRVAPAIHDRHQCCRAPPAVPLTWSTYEASARLAYGKSNRSQECPAASDESSSRRQLAADHGGQRRLRTLAVPRSEPTPSAGQDRPPNYRPPRTRGRHRHR